MLIADIEFEMREDPEIVMDIDREEVVDVEMQNPEVRLVRDSDHSHLINRELADQHPITAITGLEDALEESSVEEMTMLDIIDMWNSI